MIFESAKCLDFYLRADIPTLLRAKKGGALILPLKSGLFVSCLGDIAFAPSFVDLAESRER